MIFHVTDGNFKVLAAVTDDVPDGWILQDDDRVEELETGTSTFSFTVGYRFNKSKSDPFSRTNAANIFKAGNHIFKTNNWGSFSSDQVYTIVTSEENFKDGTFTVESEDLGLDLLNDVLPAAEEKSATAKEFMDEALKGTDFIFKINDAQDIPAKALSFSEETVSSRILNIADAFGMRVRYRYEFDNNGFKTDGTNHGKIIDFISKNSENNGTILYMNTDIEDMHVQTDVSDLVTALEVSGTNDVGNSINLSGFTVPDTDKSRYVLKGTVLRDTVAYRNYPGYNGRNNEGFLTGIFNYSNQVKNQEELYEAAKKQLIELSSPKVTYEVDLYDNVLYEKNVSVGETVSIVEDDISETYLTAVVQKLEVSELSGRATITLGDYKIASSGIGEQVQRIANRLQEKLNDLQVYTWIVYADDVSGTNISLEPTYEDGDGVTQFHTYMGVASNRVNMDIDISDPTIFKWSRIQGHKGDDGISYYLHVAYCNRNSDGTYSDFSTTESEGKTYIGTYTDTNPQSSEDPTKYNWQLVKGRDADQQVTHFAYANREGGYYTDFSTVDNTGRKWLGICVDKNADAPTTPQSYVWSKVVGDDGTSYSVKVANEGNGATITVTDSNGNVTSTAFVADGKDGQSIKGDDAYLHVAYAFSSDGKDGFSTTWVKGASYVGLLSNHTEEDSTNYTDYEWSLIKGADGHSPKVTAVKSGDTTTIYVDDEERATIKDGKKGDKGDPGADGVSTYTHVAYANRKNALTPQNAVQSITGNDNGVITFSSVDGSNKYYTPVVSDDGVLSFNESDIPITVKVSGNTLVFSSAELIDFSLTDPTGRDYIGTLTDHNETASTNPYAYTWVRVKGKGISSYSQEFYLSSSDKTISGGEWALDMPERKDGYYYWVRYHTVYDDDTEVYSDPHLLTDLNEVWGVVRKNTSDISKQGSEINLHSQSISYAQNVADQAKAKADANESNIANNTEGLTAIRKQTSDLQTNYDNITGTVTDNQEAIGALRTAIAQLTTLGFTVATSNYDTQSTIDGHGIMVYDKSKCPTDSDGKVTSIPNEAIIAQFTSGQSLIQSVKIITAIIMGHHNIETVNAKEWDNTAAYGIFKEESSESAGTGFMYTGS